MNYRPDEKTARLWDTWLLEENGTCHLFFLCMRGTPLWNTIGHARSKDLLHWETLPFLNTLAAGSDDAASEAWDGPIVLSGSVIKTPQGYAMAYGGENAKIERIGMLFSPDLLHWEKHTGNPVLVPQPPYYESSLQASRRHWVEMRDAFLQWRPDLQQYEALFCARENKPALGAPGCVGRALSPDLKTWNLTPPLFAPGRFNALEMPTRARIGSRFYLFFHPNKYHDSNLGNSEYPTSWQSAFYAVSPTLDGPYRWQPDQLLMTADAGCGRVLDFGATKIYVHPVTRTFPFFALPKRIVQAADGRLSLAYWSGLDALHKGVYRQSFRDLAGPVQAAPATNVWRIAPDQLQGGTENQSLVCFPDQVSDFDLRVELGFGTARAAGVCAGMGDDGRGLVVLLDRKVGELAVCPMKLGPPQRLVLNGDPSIFFAANSRPGSLTDGLQVYLFRLPAPPRDTHALRVFARSEGLDVYLDGRHVLCCAPGNRILRGRIGFFLHEGSAWFQALDIRRLEPEKLAYPLP